MTNKIIRYPKIILIEPQLGENIGSSARAMLNFGFTDLAIVRPREDWPNKKAIATSVGALQDKNFNVKIFNNIKSATKNVSYLLATTARERDINKPVFNIIEAVKILLNHNINSTTGIIFGCEKSGLENKDLVKADAIANIECNKNFNSINLSMSVFSFCYQWFIENNKRDSISYTQSQTRINKIANKSELNYLLERLVAQLDKNKFFVPIDKKDSMIKNIEAIFTRNSLTDQEIKILHGIISSFIKG